MAGQLEIQIRDLFYEIMAILQDPEASHLEVKTGASITKELHAKLQAHPTYHDKHHPNLQAAVKRVVEKIAMEKEEARVTAELVASIDQFLPGAQERRCLGAGESESEIRPGEMKGGGNRCLAGNLDNCVADISFGVNRVRDSRVQKTKAVSRGKFSGRPITASQLRCLWACFLPPDITNQRCSRKRDRMDRIKGPCQKSRDP